MKIFDVKNLSVYYGTVKALDKVSFYVEEEEIVAMIGPNGAGKSTALNTVSGVVKLKGKSSGNVIFNGERIENIEPYKLVKKGLSLVPEGRRIFNTMSVIENLEMGAYTLNDRMKIKEALKKIFSLFPRLRERRGQRAGTLSSGEQQMLSMARALMLEPKMLLIDEPSLGLSPNYVREVFEKLKEINKNGTSILLVEQNARMALKYSDRAYVFEIGKIAFEGRSIDLLKNEKVKKAFLGN